MDMIRRLRPNTTVLKFGAAVRKVAIAATIVHVILYYALFRLRQNSSFATDYQSSRVLLASPDRPLSLRAPSSENDVVVVPLPTTVSRIATQRHTTASVENSTFEQMTKCTVEVMNSTAAPHRATTAERQKSVARATQETATNETHHKVALIIPYRDRASHLAAFVGAIVPFLNNQNVSFQIYVVEQVANQTFNKGKLMNVGFLYAKHSGSFGCFIFHDVDLVPESSQNIYQCGLQPTHFAVAVDTLHYRLLYDRLMGGVTGFTSEQFLTVNGYSNDYWGWGGEDDDIHVRTKAAGLSILRHSNNVSRYRMIRHTRDRLNAVNPCRHYTLRQASRRWKSDGLNNLLYQLVNVEQTDHYVKLLVDALPKLTYRRLC